MDNWRQDNSRDYLDRDASEAKKRIGAGSSKKDINLNELLFRTVDAVIVASLRSLHEKPFEPPVRAAMHMYLPEAFAVALEVASGV